MRFEWNIVRRWVLGCIGLVSAVCAQSQTSSPTRGVVHLAEARWERGIELNGPWEFYWKRLLLPGDALAQPDFLMDPLGPWKNLDIPGKANIEFGYASYRLLVQGLPLGRQTYTLQVRNAGRAFRVFVYPEGRPDQFQEAQSGLVGASPEAERPSKKTRSLTFSLDNVPNLVILIQASNHGGAVGGLWYPPVIGREQVIADRQELVAFRELIAIGIVLSSSIYLALIWVRDRRNRASLFLALSCLAGVVRFSAMNSSISSVLSDEWYDLLRVMEYLSMPASIVFFICFLEKCFPWRRLAGRWYRIYLGSSIPLVIAPLVVSELIFTRYLLIFQIHMLISAGLSLAVMVNAIRLRYAGSWLLALGVAVLTLSISIDVLSSFDFLPAWMQVSVLGAALFIILQAQIVAEQAAAARRQADQEKEHALQAEIKAREAEQMARIADQKALAAREKALLEEQRLSALKDEFISNTSHELKTPLNAMLGLSEGLLRTTGNQPKVHAAVQDIHQAAKGLHKLVTRILDFGTLSQGLAEVRTDPVGLRILIERLYEDFQEEAAKKGLQMRVEYPPPAVGILGSFDYSYQVIAALLDNAIKFSKAGTIEIQTSIVGDRVLIRIQDQGCGMSMETIERARKGFYQADGTQTRTQGGLGLGLTLASKFMVLQNGMIAISSQEGRGTQVDLQFCLCEAPLTRAADQEVKKHSDREESRLEPPPLSEPSPPLSGLAERSIVGLRSDHERSETQPSQNSRTRILIVDDEASNRKVVQSILFDFDYDIFEAVDGYEALSAFEKHAHFDAVLLDVMMPGLSGYEVCERLRKQYPAHKLPILMLTAKQQTQDLARGFAAGANDYVHKPIIPDELRARLSAHLQISASARSMGRFVPEDFIRLLGCERLTDLKLGDVKATQLTIFFADIRHFTSRIETMMPEEIFRWLNSCYSQIGPVIRASDGFVDKFIGDAVMALFPHRVEDALNAGLEAIRVMKDFNVAIGIGIHHGLTMLGTLGEPERFEATVLADAVNVAARLETLCKRLGCDLLISGDTLRALKSPESYHIRCIGRYRLKGRKQVLDLFEVLHPTWHAEKIQAMGQFNEAMRLIQQRDYEGALSILETVHNSLLKDDLVSQFIYSYLLENRGKYERFDGVLQVAG